MAAGADGAFRSGIRIDRAAGDTKNVAWPPAQRKREPSDWCCHFEKPLLECSTSASRAALTIRGGSVATMTTTAATARRRVALLERVGNRSDTANPSAIQKGYAAPPTNNG